MEYEVYHIQLPANREKAKNDARQQLCYVRYTWHVQLTSSGHAAVLPF